MLFISLRQVEIFCAIALKGSTVAAADHLGLSQSATSSALRQLEHLLGRQLFDRCGRQLLLNDAGRSLLPAATALLEQALQLQEAFSTDSSQLPARLKISASTTIANHVLPAILASFHHSHPQVTVDLHTGNTREVTTALSNHEADLGLIEGINHAPTLQASLWMPDELVLVAAASDPLLTSGKPVSLHALRTARWLLREPGSGTREMVDNSLLPHLHQLDHVSTLGSSSVIAECVARGLGISCLPRTQVQSLLDNGSLQLLGSTLPVLKRNFYFLQRKQQQNTPVLQAFIDCCQRQTAQHD